MASHQPRATLGQPESTAWQLDSRNQVGVEALPHVSCAHAPTEARIL